jgi:hypothetical protein
LLIITAPLSDHLVSNRTVQLVTDRGRTPVRCRKLYAADERRPAGVSHGREVFTLGDRLCASGALQCGATSVLVGQPQRACRRQARDSSLRLDRVSRTVGGESAHVCLTQDPCVRTSSGGVVFKALAFGVIFFLATFPATWLLMLFAGNVGLRQSYWGTLPLGILVSVLLAGVTKPSVAVIRRQTL